MPQVSSHQPGTFCWFELGTSDWKAAKKFYTSLFGWKANEVPMEENSPPYVLLQKGGKDAGALYQMPETQKGVPPFWMIYVAVKSADETAKKAKKLGGKVEKEPFDVFDLGRMAVLTDPQGAVFALWQAGKNPGVSVMNEANSVCWSELQTSDTEAAKKFYTSLFGWGAKAGGEYTEWQIGKESMGGMVKNPAPDTPPHWMIYFAVDDCDATTKKAQSLGGPVYVKPKEMENVGRFSVVADPQRAMFALIRLFSA